MVKGLVVASVMPTRLFGNRAMPVVVAVGDVVIVDVMTLVNMVREAVPD